jgi:hypothetical protein
MRNSKKNNKNNKNKTQRRKLQREISRNRVADNYEKPPVFSYNTEAEEQFQHNLSHKT